MVDGEGTVCNPPKEQGGARTIRITNTDPALIEACCACCDRLGLSYRIHTIKPRKAHHRVAWSLVITKHASLKIFAEQVPLLAPKKKFKLNVLLASYRRPPYTVEPTKELLHRLYVDEKKSFEEIRKHIGARSHGTIGHWLRKHGIKVTRKQKKRL